MADWQPSVAFVMLASLKMKKDGKRHYVEECLRSVEIITRELGFPTVLQYLYSRGWVMQKRKDSSGKTVPGKLTLRYRKIEDSLDFPYHDPLDTRVSPAMNLHSMIKSLYKELQMGRLKNKIPESRSYELPPVTSLLSTLNGYTQDAHTMYLLTDHFFLPHVPEKSNDIDFWVAELFRHARTQVRLVSLCTDIFFRFPDDDDISSEDVKELLTTYRECFRDELQRQAAEKRNLAEYNSLLESKLTTAFRGRSVQPNERVSRARNLLMLRARVRDQMYAYLSDVEKEQFSSSTRIFRGKKGAGGESNDKDPAVSGEFHWHDFRLITDCSPSLDFF